MSQLEHLHLNDRQKRSIFLFGSQTWNRERILKESFDAGLRVVLAKVASDTSGELPARVLRDSDGGFDTETLAHTTEILPDQLSAISTEMLDRLRQHYGVDWCALPLNDYMAEYAAAISTRLSDPCYPPRSAVIVKRKHELRDMWNCLASRPDSGLYGVEYCYAEQRMDSAEFDYYPSSGYNALPEKTPFVVKPDELSGSIEIRYAESKKESLAAAREICSQLLSKWRVVGRMIGTEVHPRVVIERAIERSDGVHPGAEYSIEFVSFQGQHYMVGITQKWVAPNFLETGHLFPAESIPGRLKPVLERAMKRLLEQLGVRYGVSHWEFIITPDERIALVEGHLRPAGGRIMELIEYSTGRSPVAALCEALAQKSVDLSFTPHTSCGIFWMVPRTPLAKVDEIRIDRTAISAHCKDVHINHEGIKTMQNWSQATDWITRFAHVIATGDNLDTITNCGRQIAQNVTLSGNANGASASTSLKLAIDS